MDDAFRLRRIQRVRHFDSEGENRLQRQGHAADPVLEGDSLEQLHRDEGMAVRFINVMNGADVGMVERGRCLCLTPEALEHSLIASDSFRQKLEGDEAAKLRIFSSEHDAHPAAAQFFQNAIVGDRAADWKLVFCHVLGILVRALRLRQHRIRGMNVAPRTGRRHEPR